MALVDTSTGELVAACTPDEARQLTEAIRGAAEQVWSLLVAAHDRQAWSALGYSTWADYVRTEFDMSRRQAYYLLDQGRVAFAIEEASGVQHVAQDLTIREAQEIKPRLKAVTDSIKEKVTAEATVEPERVKEIVAEAVAEHVEQAKQKTEDRAALAALNAKGRAAGMDLDEKSLTERGDWSTYCRELAKTADPSVFLARHRAHLTDRHIAQAERAYAWLDSFLLEYREAQ